MGGRVGAVRVVAGTEAAVAAESPALDAGGLNDAGVVRARAQADDWVGTDRGARERVTERTVIAAVARVHDPELAVGVVAPASHGEVVENGAAVRAAEAERQRGSRAAQIDRRAGRDARVTPVERKPGLAGSVQPPAGRLSVVGDRARVKPARGDRAGRRGATQIDRRDRAGRDV